jgi:uncharacterized membrane protein
MSILFALLALLVFFGPLILALSAFYKAKNVERQTTKAERSLEALTSRVAKLTSELESLGNSPGPDGPAKPKMEKAPTPVVQEKDDAVTEPPYPKVPKRSAFPPETRTMPSPWPPEFARRPITAKGLEEALTSRWLVWLGAVALALGGTFLVKYTIDQGWLVPSIRVSLGFVLGVSLALGGEWLRRRPLQRAIAALQPDYVPPALTAAGIFTAFASIYAAHAIHDLLPPLVAFAGLATVALGAVGLSLLQGRFVALLGLLGAFATPALVATPEPSAWALFGYVLVIQVSCLAVVRYKAWWWLAAAALAGGAWWAFVWILPNWQTANTLPIGLFLLLMAAVFLFLRDRSAQPEDPNSWPNLARAASVPEQIAWAGGLVVAELFFLTVQQAGHSAAALAFVGSFGMLALFASRREAIFDGLFVAAAILTVTLMATWQLPASLGEASPLYIFGGEQRGTLPGTPLVPSELSAFVWAMLAFGGLFGIGGFVALWGARRPALWAGVSAAVSVLLFVIAYWRILDFRVDLGWAALALAFAALCLLAAARIARHPRTTSLDLCLGFYAAAVVAFLGLGAAMALQQAWLTVALSLQLPMLAWLGRRLSNGSFQIIASVIAIVVLVRLVFNYNVLDYPLDGHWLLSWIVYGYGIPAAMFLWAARSFRQQDAAPLVTLLQAGGTAFAVLLVTLEIRVLATGSLDNQDYDLLEQGLQSVAWLAMAYALALHHRRSGETVSFFGARILTIVAVVQVVLLQLLLNNPLLTQDPVGATPVFNSLFLAYALPAAVALPLARELKAWVSGLATCGLAGLSLVLIFVYLSLEVARTFQGQSLSLADQSDAEIYAYSLVWLIYAGALLALGIRRKQTALRYASLLVLLIATVKVFVFDMGDLTGLLRVASFLGLGLCLVGIGFLYQRYVFHKPGTKPPSEATGAT